MYLYPEGDEYVPAAKLRWQPFVGMAAHAAANVLESFSGLCRAVATEFFSAANHVEEQEHFRVRAALEIEALTTDTPLLVPAWSDEAEDDDYDDEDEDDD